MENTQELHTMQQAVLVAAMTEAGIEQTVAESVIERAQGMLQHLPGPAPRNVSVYQRADVVEAGATVIGYKADRIG